MKRIAVVGAGISGLSAAQMLHNDAQVVVYEREHKAGGLICCERINGSLFHTCGGHVFNTKNDDVLNWFWQHFNKDTEFIKADRNSVIILENGQHIPYPIENYAYLLESELQQQFIQDLLHIASKNGSVAPADFQSFLRSQFGETLYKLYFEPYNLKVWRRELSDVPLDWLAGKLPMPTVQEIIYNNFNRVAEKQFVHSTFYYEKQDGSQLIANRLAEGLDIRYKSEIEQIVFYNNKWLIGSETYDKVIFTGNLKYLPHILVGLDIAPYASEIEKLQYHGTTAVFCEIDANPYSWIYLPDRHYSAHRIICTGNFAPTNNATTPNRITATIEFTDQISKEEIINQLQLIPLHPKYITHKYNRYTYPIQQTDTRQMIASLKQMLKGKSFYITGRFADWEYYNMDAAIAASMRTIKDISI